MKKQSWLIAIRFVFWKAALLWCKTLKIIKVQDEQFEILKKSGKNYIVAFWHGSMFIGWFLHRPMQQEKISALVSRSNDGEFLSAVLERWKYSMIRGSSHIGGKEAMQLMVDAVASGSSLAITPDGPRGPRHEMKMGAVRVAQKTGVPLVLAGIGVHSKKYLRSWDQFEVPMLFSSVVVKYSEPMIVPAHLTGEALDEYNRDVQKTLNALTMEAEQQAGDKGNSR